MSPPGRAAAPAGEPGREANDQAANPNGTQSTGSQPRRGHLPRPARHAPRVWGPAMRHAIHLAREWNDPDTGAPLSTGCYRVLCAVLSLTTSWSKLADRTYRATIAGKAGVSDRTVTRALATLTRAGILSWTPGTAKGRYGLLSLRETDGCPECCVAVIEPETTTCHEPETDGCPQPETDGCPTTSNQASYESTSNRAARFVDDREGVQLSPWIDPSKKGKVPLIAARFVDHLDSLGVVFKPELVHDSVARGLEVLDWHRVDEVVGRCVASKGKSPAYLSKAMDRAIAEFHNDPIEKTFAETAA